MTIGAVKNLLINILLLINHKLTNKYIITNKSQAY